MAKGAKKATATAAAEVEAPILRFNIGGTVYEIEADVSTMTWGEQAEVEAHFNADLDEVNFTAIRGTLFLAYLALKRKAPTATYEDVARLSGDELGVEVVERPTGTPASTGVPA